METITLKWINNKVLICSTENYFQYPVINYNGKEYKKECIDVFLSFCSVTEIGITVNQLYFNKNKNKLSVLF